MTGHFLLDTVLPPRLLELSTPAERMELAGSLQRVLDRQTRYWLAPAILLALSLRGFFLELRRDRK